MRRCASHVLLLLAAPLAGCLSDVSLLPAEDPPLKVEGPTRGYSPTAAYLKVHVDTPGGQRVLVDFDRRDWHVAEVARRLDDQRLRFLIIEGPPRLMGEVVAETVHTPEDLAGLRYDAMGATHEERLLLDAEYADMLRRLAEAAPAPEAPAAPVPALPPLT